MERINRATDRQVYQPRLHADLIRELYLLKVQTGLPMTVLVEMAVILLLDKYHKDEGTPPANHS